MANGSCGCDVCQCDPVTPVVVPTPSVQPPTPFPEPPDPVPAPPPPNNPPPIPNNPFDPDDPDDPDSVTKEPWFKDFWKPAMAWTFCFIVIFDFILGPIFNWLFFYYSPHAVFVPWVPLTLGAGGLFYVCMMVILGITALNSPTRLADGTIVGGLGNRFIQPPQ